MVAAAFLDLVDPNNAVPKMLAAVRDGGAIYLPINFDGMTHFGPSTDTNVGNFDDIVIERFHAAMGTTATGALHNRTGRLLLSYILALSGVELRRVGSSSWTVVPTRGSSCLTLDYKNRLLCLAHTLTYLFFFSPLC